MDRKTAEILVKGLKACFMVSKDYELGGNNISNIADGVSLIAYSLKTMYVSFGPDGMSLKEASDLKLEDSMESIASSLSEISQSIDNK